MAGGGGGMLVHAAGRVCEDDDASLGRVLPESSCAYLSARYCSSTFATERIRIRCPASCGMCGGSGGGAARSAPADAPAASPDDDMGTLTAATHGEGLITATTLRSGTT